MSCEYWSHANKSKADLLHSTLQSQRNSPLLRLPGELRNKIYHYALEGIHIVVVDKPYSNDIEDDMEIEESLQLRAWQDCAQDLKEPKALLGLTRVCRQVHAELGILPSRSSLYTWIM
jgi:hypothetical protein